MASNITASTIQEAAAKFANTVLAGLNQAAAEVAGVDVMYFRAIPDKRNQDVIFQSYTLYGVEDCPLSFKAVYTDTNYDDAALTYNIMGLNYAIPMTLDIALNTWKEVTGDDGTIPQQHDVVYVPMSRKLLQVVSMQPVKTLGAQLSSYKINLEVYKPAMNRIVGENLKETIKETTTNLHERFGDEIDEQIRNIVDDNQLSILSSTEKDRNKTVEADVSEESSIFDIREIEMRDLIVDGHTVSRGYYKLQDFGRRAVTYHKTDKFTSDDCRYYSCWVRPKETNVQSVIKNIKDDVAYSTDGKYGYLSLSLGGKFNVSDKVVLKRGKMIVPGTVVEKNKIQISLDTARRMSKVSPTWYKLPGFAVVYDNVINLLNGGDFSLDIKGSNYISISYGEKEQLIMLTSEMKTEYWYGVCVNLGPTISVDIYSKDDSLHKIIELKDIKNTAYNEVEVKEYMLLSSFADMTNIRFYDTANTNIDKQITDLVSYNALNDSHCIVNDGADVYLNKPYLGRQR